MSLNNIGNLIAYNYFFRDFAVEFLGIDVHFAKTEPQRVTRFARKNARKYCKMLHPCRFRDLLEGKNLSALCVEKGRDLSLFCQSNIFRREDSYFRSEFPSSAVSPFFSPTFYRQSELPEMSKK